MKCFTIIRMCLGALIVISNVQASAQTIDEAAHRSIVEALQSHIAKHPSAFPLEAPTEGAQTYLEGLQYPYFGYGERRYTYRTDFHPAIDVAYDVLEVAKVKQRDGKTQRVRAPKTYLKKVYAIQDGELVSIELIGSGYKMMLKHALDTPYRDAEGRAYNHYYTSYRHLDARSLDHLDGLARKSTGVPDASHRDLFGKHVFKAGEQIAVVGFAPPSGKSLPRAHLDFSLNLYTLPTTGPAIRKYAFNPLLLYPAFQYGAVEDSASGEPSYRFTIDGKSAAAPSPKRDGRFVLQIESGVSSTDQSRQALRYFALNGMEVTVYNGGSKLADFEINRHLKRGYNIKSYTTLDRINSDIPHFVAPVGEQSDVFRIGAVLPSEWLDSVGYDWSKSGKISVSVTSIWSGHLPGHGHRIEFPLSAQDN